MSGNVVMSCEDARDLLLAAGVAEDKIDADAIQVARLYSEIIMRVFTKMMAQKIVEKMLSDDERFTKLIRSKVLSND